MQRNSFSWLLTSFLTVTFWLGSYFLSTVHAGVNRWTSNGPNLPGVQVLAIAPSNAQIVYAGTNRGSFKSTSGGLNWTQRLNPDPRLDILIGKSIQAIAVDPKDAQIVYVGVPGEGVYKSTDGGVNWTIMKTGLTDLFINTLVIDPLATTTIYAGVSSGVFKSNDGAGNWGPVSTGLNGAIISSLAIDPSAPAILYAGTTTGVYRTANGGGRWVLRSTGLPPGTFIKAIAVARSSPQILYIGTDGGGCSRVSTGAAIGPP